MNKLKVAGFFFTALCAMGFTSEAYSQNGAVIVSIEGVKNNTGRIGVLLFNQAKGFPGDDKVAFRQALVPAKKGKVEVVFEDVPAGTYAVAVMHDENENLKIDTNMLGIPKEGYGASNNVRNMFRGPRFEEAAFQFRGDQSSIRIDLIY